MALTANLRRRTNRGRTFHAQDFMPRWSGERKLPTPHELQQKLLQAFGMAGVVVPPPNAAGPKASVG